MKILPAILLCVFLCSPAVISQDKPKAREIKNNALFASEELTYEVSWWAFDLGTITMYIWHDSAGYLAVCHIDSYDGVPFADLHSIFRTIMDSNANSKAFTALDKEEKNKWNVTKYIYNEDKSLAIVKRGTVKDPTETMPVLIASDTLSIDRLTQDGLSLFYFARRHLRSKDTITVKAIVTEKVGSATINFYGKETVTDIDAVDYPVSVIEFDGKANFKGIFGLTGEFKGWFSNDDAHVPIKAKVGVILGSVTMELISWKRTGWVPPRKIK